MKRTFSVNESYFDNWSENSAYLLGFIYADGNIELDKYNRPTRLGFGLSSKDEVLLEWIKDELKYQGNITRQIQKLKVTQKEYPISRLRISSRKLCQGLYDLGAVNQKTFKITWPKCLPSHLERHFIRGYFDGDGSLTVRNDSTQNPVACLLGTKELLKEIQNKFSDFYDKKIGSLYKRNNIYVLYIHGKPSCKSFCKWLYLDSGIALERKRQKALSIIKND